jgi:acyl dehydratase
MGLNWKFRAPIFLGDTIRLLTKVSRLRPMPSMGGGLVVFELTVLNQRDETAQEGEWTLLVKSR